MARRYGLTARQRFPVKSRRISKDQLGAVAHGNLCLQLCFNSLGDGLGLNALPAGAQLRIRFLRPVSIGDEVSFEVLSATERPGVLAVEAECRVRGETVAVVVARTPWPAEEPAD